MAQPMGRSVTGKIDFWFEFASTYSYLSVMRISDLAQARGITVRWRPFLLGPIFRDQGWETSPFALYQDKGAYMWRDMERRCAARGLPFRRPALTGAAAFPQNGLYAARLALIGFDQGWGEGFTRRVFTAQFGEGKNIAGAALLADLASQSGAPAEAVTLSGEADIKQRLADQVDEARHNRIFGAPSFMVGSELFWGDDRLEEALDWAAG